MKLNNEERRDIFKKLIVVFSGIGFYFFIFKFTTVSKIFIDLLIYSRPIIIGFVIAFIANMVMNQYEKLFKYLGLKNKKVRDLVSMILAFLSMLLLITFFLSVVLPKFITSVLNLMYQLPDLVNNSIDKLKNMPMSAELGKNVQKFIEEVQVQNLINKVIEILKNDGALIASGTFNVVSRIFSSFFEGFLSISFSIYILSSKDRLRKNAKQVTYALFSEKLADKIVYVSRLLYKNFYNFFSGQFLEAILLGIIVFSGITIIGAPYSLILGVTAGLLNLIPYIGALVGAVISTVLISITSPTKGLIFLVYIIVAQQIDGNYIYPKLVGSKVGIPAIWIMVAITLGGALMGIIGMIIFVPLVATVYVLVREYSKKKLIEKQIDISKK
ncbi:AI-2E family transporter [Helcococcus ovis]|uniref:AI-2E family transporter n=1 Tax=Helcococcus ovis TaxID=72026 RepID=A0A4R9BZT6_9FIRM|nr:AI-2E family transporter [Helcococcus ovis]TFF63895.1 AI-2E family transporter [Helcococcus ovis]TFF64594.1 AI-2E family transporter [Helcococcus ovis]TFF67888.1 AI-2E family transporter [Helcococcus ovis]WNZ01574.1 AI-2E family transporter [Helcococcus ovis]